MPKVIKKDYIIISIGNIEIIIGKKEIRIGNKEINIGNIDVIKPHWRRGGVYFDDKSSHLFMIHTLLSVNIFSGFSSNSKAFASELCSDKFGIFKMSVTH